VCRLKHLQPLSLICVFYGLAASYVERHLLRWMYQCCCTLFLWSCRCCSPKPARIHWVLLCFKTRFKGFELHVVKNDFVLSFFFSFNAFFCLHLSMQLSFPLLHDICAHEGNVQHTSGGCVWLLWLWVSSRLSVCNIVDSTGLEYVDFFPPTTLSLSTHGMGQVSSSSLSLLQSTLCGKLPERRQNLSGFMQTYHIPVRKRKKVWRENQKIEIREEVWNLPPRSQFNSALVLQFSFTLVFLLLHVRNKSKTNHCHEKNSW